MEQCLFRNPYLAYNLRIFLQKQWTLQTMDLSIKFTGTKEFHTKFVSAQTFANHKFGKWIKNIYSLKTYNVLMRTL